MGINDISASSGAIIVSGAAIGGMAGGVPGFIIGGLIGSVLQEFIKCPKCGNPMKFIEGLWRCEKCGYVKVNS